MAVEYNELAVLTCARNLKHNQRRSEVDLIQADARHFAHLPADLALANIHLDVLLDLLAIPEFLNKNWYIFSGILGAQLDKLLPASTARPSPMWRPWMKTCGLRCWPRRPEGLTRSPQKYRCARRGATKQPRPATAPGAFFTFQLPLNGRQARKCS